MKLDADARKRLRDSIAHWERIATDTRLPGETIFAEDCALCRRFIDLRCVGCPVKSCEKGSQWHRVSDAFILHGEDSPKFFAAARSMLAFLRQLDAEADVMTWPEAAIMIACMVLAALVMWRHTQ